MTGNSARRSRRRTTTGLAALLVAAFGLPATATTARAAGSSTPPRDTAHGALPAVALSSAPGGGDGFVNIVAHQDDDLLFLNPMMLAPLRAGSPSLTVFLTAGEACGVGGDCAKPATSREDFAANRQNGSRAAYAFMLGVPDTWDRQAVTGAGGAAYELDTLHAAPQVKLAFLSIRDGGDTSEDATDSKHYSYNLANLDDNVYPQIQTLVPTGSVVPTPQTYTKAGLLQTLTGILQQYQPTVVRTQSPGNVYGYHYDNTDHKEAAYFTDQALTGYHGPGGSGRLVVEHYRDYDLDNLPDNLSATQRQDKENVFSTYATFDQNAINTGLSSGDYASWPQRLYSRWSEGAAWTAKDRDGRLEAFAVEDNQVMRWYQTSPGGAWAGPQALGGGGGSYLAPQIAVGTNADGRLQVFALRYDGLQDTSSLITASQTTAGGSFSAWTSLGNPDNAHYQTGSPTVAANADGRLQVFTKNYHGGVSTAVQSTPGGAFSGWTDLGGGPGVQDGLAAATDRTGRINLFATKCQLPPSGSPPDDGNGGAIYDDGNPQPCGMTRWSQTSVNGAGTWDAQQLISSTVSSQPSVTADQDGRLQVFYRQGGGSDVLTLAQNADNTWGHTPVELSGNGGTGTPGVFATSGADGRIVAVTRDNTNAVSVIGQQAANGGFGAQWSALGGMTEGLPTGNVDSTGRAVLFRIATNGQLFVDQQTSPGSQLSFNGWQLVGNATTVPASVQVSVNGSSASGQTVSGTITVTAVASTGSELDYLVDGAVTTQLTNSSPPFQTGFSTSQWFDGAHQISARIKNASGTVLATSPPVTVIVTGGQGVPATQQPRVASVVDGNGTMRIFTLASPNGELEETYHAADGGTAWTCLTCNGGAEAGQGAPAAVTGPDGTLRIFTLARSGFFHSGELDETDIAPAGTVSWTCLSCNGGAEPAQGEPDAVVDASGTVHILTVAKTTGELDETLRPANGTVSWKCLSCQGGAPNSQAVPSAVVDKSGNVHVFTVRAQSGDLDETVSTPGGGVSWTCVTCNGGAPATGADPSAVLDGAGVVHVITLGSSGEVEETRKAPDGGTTWTCLTCNGGAEPAEGSPSATTDGSGTIHVFSLAQSGFFNAGEVDDTRISPSRAIDWTCVSCNGGADPGQGTPTGILDRSGVVRIYSVAAGSGDLEETQLNPSGFVLDDLTVNGGAPAVGV